jgi:hypothetical protein
VASTTNFGDFSQNSKYSQALRKAIDDSEVERLEAATPDFGLHGTLCMVVVIGDTRAAIPGVAPIPVAIAMYPRAPESLLLFHDIKIRKVCIMQAKGCFKNLPPVERHLLGIGLGCKWVDLPGTSYQGFANKKVLPPKVASSDVLALLDSLTIKVPALYRSASAQTTQGVQVQMHISNL